MSKHPFHEACVLSDSVPVFDSQRLRELRPKLESELAKLKTKRGWSSSRPTESGYYWARMRDGGVCMTYVKICDKSSWDCVVEFFGGGDAEPLDECVVDAWSGPLEVPQ